MLRHRPQETTAIVLNAGERFLNCLSPVFGVEAKAYIDDMDRSRLAGRPLWDGKNSTLDIRFQGGKLLKVTVLSTIRVRLFTAPGVVPLEIRMEILPPPAE